MPKPGFKAFSATNIQDASGLLLASGTLSVMPTDSNDRPVSAIVGSGGGPLTYAPAVTPINGGGISSSFEVADTEATTPRIQYRVTIKDADGTPIAVFKGVRTLGASFDLSSYDPTAGTSGTATGGTGAYSLVAVDSVTGTNYTLSVVNGALELSQSGSGGAAQFAIFADTVTGTLYQLGVSNGALLSTIVSSGASVASMPIVDSVSGATFTLSYANGARTLA